MITVRVDTSKLEKMLVAKSVTMKKSLQQVLVEEGRLLAVALAKYTQPFGLGPDAEKKGEGAIIRDYHRVYPALAAQFIINRVAHIARPKDKDAAASRIAKYVRAGDTKSITKMLGDMRIARQGTEADPKYHADRWRSGKLKGGVAQIVPDQASVQKLIDQAKVLSGFAKSGWATCAQKLGGTRGIPAWARRAQAPGQIIDNTDADPPVLTLVNKVNYTNYVLSDSGMSAAIRERATKIQLNIDNAVKKGLRNA